MRNSALGSLRGLAASGILALTLAAASAQVPAGDPSIETDRFDIEYVAPKDPAHRGLYEMMKSQRLLEKFQELFSPVRLPERIVLRLEGCDGVANASFWQNTISVCYEYFEFLEKHAPKMGMAGLTPRDALIGPTVDVFLHELGHAIVQTLDIPFFGREEEAADYIATTIMLQFFKDDARRLILGASFISGSEAMEEQGRAPELVSLADVHSLPAVRYFNRWCMAYGYNPALFADAMSLGMLPMSRSKHCRYEYATNEFAFRQLVEPYIDQNLKAKIASRKWFEFESTTPAMMIAPVAATTGMPASAAAPSIREQASHRRAAQCPHVTER
jgi:hypothetical protein